MDLGKNVSASESATKREQHRRKKCAGARNNTDPCERNRVCHGHVHTIPDTKTDDIERSFKYSNITKTEGEPDYEQICVMRAEIFRNAISIRSIFVGGNH